MGFDGDAITSEPTVTETVYVFDGGAGVGTVVGGTGLVGVGTTPVGATLTLPPPQPESITKMTQDANTGTSLRRYCGRVAKATPRANSKPTMYSVVGGTGAVGVGICGGVDAVVGVVMRSMVLP